MARSVTETFYVRTMTTTREKTHKNKRGADDRGENKGLRDESCEFATELKENVSRSEEAKHVLKVP